jgi:hypothetical protein
MNLNTAMDALGTALGGITGLNVYDFHAESVADPAAIVGLPDELVYDHTHGRGTDRATFPVHVLVCKADDRSARDLLAAYCGGTGGVAVSVKAALDALAGVRVVKADFSVMTMASVEYLAATFDVDYVA